jgi:hypothetical protein
MADWDCLSILIDNFYDVSCRGRSCPLDRRVAVVVVPSRYVKTAADAVTHIQKKPRERLAVLGCNVRTRITTTEH